MAKKEVSKKDVINDITLLQKYREQEKMSRQEVAEKLGVNERTVWAWETGQNSPNSISIMLICNWLGVDIDDTNQEEIQQEEILLDTIEEACSVINSVSQFLMNLDYSRSEIENLDIHNLEMTFNHANRVKESIGEMFSVKKAIDGD